MAKPTRRGGKWFVQVQVAGQRKSKSFPTKKQAELWAAQTEIDLHDESLGRAVALPMFDLFERYAREVTPNKRGQRKEALRIEAFKRDLIADIKTTRLTADDVQGWASRRLETVSSATVNREWNILSAICSQAVKWGWMRDNPCSRAEKPAAGRARNRRPEGDELERILYCLGHDGRTPMTGKQRVAYAALFAVETAMRASEICNLTWDNVHDKYVHIPAAKNGHPRDVPLSTEARRIIGMMPRDDDRVFRLRPNMVDQYWRAARDAALVDDLRFHDLRHEALTRLARKLPVMDLAKMSGHRDLRILMNTYYNPRADDLADMLD